MNLDPKSSCTSSIENAPKYKITVLGSPGVGKTAILFQLTQKQFQDNFDPTISETFQKCMRIGSEYVNLSIHDTAGQDAFNSMREQYTRTAQGYLLVYSITDPQSFRNTENIYSDIIRIKDVQSFSIIVLVSNKQDLESERLVTIEEEEQLAAKLRLMRIQTSAKTGTNVEEAFNQVVILIRKDRSDPRMEICDNRGMSSNSGLSRKSNNTQNKKGSCTIL